MTATPLAKVVQGLRFAALAQAPSNTSDADLLRAFLRSRDEKAFELLVIRHGPMVLGVCRRVLRNLHDAEEAFQATFLVLARRAASIQPQSMVGNWLYGVAQRTALRARKNIMRRREIERHAMPRSQQEPSDFADVAELLDREIANLSDKLRAVLLMCDMQGRTRREAAQELGLAEGTVASRVARGRAILAKRLASHGIALSAGALAVAMSQQAIASVPAPLVTATVQTAMGKVAMSATVAALTQEMVGIMMLGKLRNVIGVALLVGLALGGLGWQGGSGGTSGRSEPAKPFVKQDQPTQAVKQNTIKIAVAIEAVDTANRTLNASDMTGAPPTGEIQLELKLDGKNGTVGKLQITGLVAERKRAKFNNLPIAKDARITVDGKEAKLADLKPGRAELDLAVGPRGLQATAIRFEAEKDKK